MKRFVILFYVCISLSALSQNKMQVSSLEASAVATKVLKQTSKRYISTQPEIVEIETLYYGEHIALYEVIFEKGENVIISGSKSAKPVLAICHESNGESALKNINDLPGGYRYFIEKMYQELCHCFDTTIPENRGWRLYLHQMNDSLFYNHRNIAEYMLKTKWDQSEGNRNCGCYTEHGLEEVYNKYTPLSNGDCEECHEVDKHYPTGCTVTALGQIMNYWQHPVLILGNTQIDWCNMPDTVDCLITTVEEKEAVAQLMQILGKKLGTTYGSLRNDNHCYGYLDPPTTMNTLSDYFGYSEDMDCIYRAWYIGSWKNAIKDEIDAGRPVLYWAIEDNPFIGAHTFVCDGYDADNDWFHFNWGHGEGGTWVSIDSIVEGYHQHWTRYESAMIKLEPNIYTDICNVTIPLELFFNTYYSAHIENYNSNTPQSSLIPCPYQLTPKTMTILTSASPTSRSEFRTIPSTATAEYRAHEEIHLQDGFTVERGAEFTAQIEPCANCESTRGVEDGSIGEIENEQEESMPDMAVGRPNIATGRSFTETVLYPNPTDGEVSLIVDGKVQTIVIYNAMGRPVGGWNLRTITPNHVTLEVSSLTRGSYIVRIHTPMGVTSRKLVVQ